ncbi:MAG: RNA polymerase sigma factor [Saprospiraceae bacterium]|nr:RNA polymerase sigma factor [Saprospiraceae bacterium]
MNTFIALGKEVIQRTIQIKALNIDIEYTIAKCLEDNRSAQQALYNYTYNHLLNAVKRYVSDGQDVNWVFNNGMLKVFNALKKYKKNTNYLGFARTILVRSSIDFLRSSIQANSIMRPLEVTFDKEADEGLEGALNKLEAEDVMSLIQMLPDKERLIFSMYEIDGFTHKDIQKHTGINKNTSKWLLAKAKKELRTKIFSHYNYKHS